MRWNAYKLIAVGLAVFSLYAAGFYFLADSSQGSEALRLPLAFRGFSYAVLSIALMWCLHEIMSFQHFFQALSIFNILHMFVGGLVGAALHARGLNYYVGEGFARYSAGSATCSCRANPLTSPASWTVSCSRCWPRV